MLLISYANLIKKAGEKLATHNIKLRYKKIAEIVTTIINDPNSQRENEDDAFSIIKSYIEQHVLQYETFVDSIFTLTKADSDQNQNGHTSFVLTEYLPFLTETLENAKKRNMPHPPIASIMNRLSGLQVYGQDPTSPNQTNIVTIIKQPQKMSAMPSNSNDRPIDEAFNLARPFFDKNLDQMDDLATYFSKNLSQLDAFFPENNSNNNSLRVESNNLANIPLIDSQSNISTTEMADVATTTLPDNPSLQSTQATDSGEFSVQFLEFLKNAALNSAALVKEKLIKETEKLSFRFQYNTDKEHSKSKESVPKIYEIEAIDTGFLEAESIPGDNGLVSNDQLYYTSIKKTGKKKPLFSR